MFKQKNRERIYLFFTNNYLVFSLIVFMFYLMSLNQYHNWVMPYLSAAKNFDFSFSMYIDKNQIDEFNKLNLENQFKFVFQSSENIEKYDYLPIGFTFVVFFATKIFSFLGDLQAINLLHQIIHIGISFLILNIIEKPRDKFLFFILYAINPIIIYFVNYPFYYFWQVIPATIFLYYFITKKSVGNLIFILSLVFLFIYMIRPSTLFFIVFIYIYFLFKNINDFKKIIFSFFMFLGLLNILPSFKTVPWHTMYVGIGGYENPYNISLSDEEGYLYFKNKTGKIYNSDSVKNEESVKEYFEVLKNRYLEIAKEEPFLLFSNALKNIISSYGFGHKSGDVWLNNLSIFAGLISILLLLYSRQYIIFLAIGIFSFSFTPYFPPIAGYMYGSYILIVFGFIKSLDFICIKHLVKEASI